MISQPNSTTLSGYMLIPADASDTVRDVLAVVRSTVASRADAKTGSVEDGREYRDAAVKGVRSAYSFPTLSTVQSKALTVSTGLRHAQVTQFGREEFMEALEIMRGWFPRATKASNKGANLALAKELTGAIQDTEVSMLQSAISGAQHGDRLTITVVKTDARQGATLTIDRGGKKAHGYYSAETDVLEVKSAAHNREIASAAMTDGRAKRVARELARASGDESKLSKGDLGWMRKDGNRDRVTRFMKALTV